MMSASKPSESQTRRPLVTVGLPCYNSEKYLAQSLESLLAQTFKDFEIIISDNASTDGTAEICKRFVAADPRVRYFRNETNIGMSGNFNRVFALSDSKYFKWATADDFWSPDLLAEAVAVLESDPTIALCYPRVVLVDSNGRETSRYEDGLHLMQAEPHERYLKLLEEVRLVNHHMGVLRSEFIKRTRMFGKQTGADIGFIAELSLYGKFYQLPSYLIFRRFHEDSSSWARGNKDHQARRFYAANVRRLPFNTWRFHWTFIRGALRSPLPVAGKYRLLKRLIKKLYWDRESLGRELRDDIPLALRKKNT